MLGVILMLMKRASAILKSKNQIEVHYKNNPIWIESIHPEIGTAEIEVLGTKEKMQVPIRDLNEL